MVRNVKILRTVVGFICITGIVSCNVGNDVAVNRSIQKRKYRAGYYVKNDFKIFNKKEVIAENTAEEVVSSEKNILYDQVKSEPIELLTSNLALNSTTKSLEEPISDLKSWVKTVSKPKEQFNAVFELSTHENHLKSFKPLAADNIEEKIVDHKTGLELQKPKEKKSISGVKVFLYFLAFIFPWLAVGIASDWSLFKILLNLLLMLLGYIPAVIHAIIVVKNNVK